MQYEYRQRNQYLAGDVRRRDEGTQNEDGDQCVPTVCFKMSGVRPGPAEEVHRLRLKDQSGGQRDGGAVFMYDITKSVIGHPQFVVPEKLQRKSAMT